MTRDSTFSYIHIDNPNQVLYIERWKDDPIPFDDIDTQSLIDATANLFPLMHLGDDEDGILPMNLATFGAKVFKNRKLLKDKVWSDLGIYEKFLNEESPLNKQIDSTILKPIYTKPPPNTFEIDDELLDMIEYQNTINTHITEGEKNDVSIATFLANGYLHDMNIPNQDLNDSMIHDISLNSSSEMIGNNSFLNMRSNSIGIQQHAQAHSQYPQGVFQTPRVTRTRQPSTDKNFQTPITRIMR